MHALVPPEYGRSRYPQGNLSESHERDVGSPVAPSESMTNEHPRDTTAWVFQTWASFTVSVAATIVGILYVPVDAWVRGYLAMGVLFTVGSTLSLAKTVRDQHEAGKLVNRIAEAKAEMMIRELELGSERAS